MKLLIVFSLSACLLAASEAKAKKIHPAKATPAPSASVSNRQIPDGAVQTDDGSYRYTDRQGTKWIYRKTPFGISHWEDRPADAAARTAESQKRYDEVKAVEDGDTIRFERPGPFGIFKWQRKKTELDEMEQTVWDRERARTIGQD